MKTIRTQFVGPERRVKWFEKNVFIESTWQFKAKELITSKISLKVIGIGKSSSLYISLSSKGSQGLNRENE